MGSASHALLQVNDLTVTFPTFDSGFQAVQHLDFEVEAGKTLAIVGESGSGKSVTSLALMRLLDYTPGRIQSGHMRFHSTSGGLDLAQATDKQMRGLRGSEISMIFQEPMTSLDPVFSIASQIMEPLILHQRLSRRAARQQAVAMLEAVHIPDAEQILGRYPHQLSGGQRQRVMIAMALACRPRLLIADEPTTALDVTIQAQILGLIRDLQAQFGTAVIFITHDMGVVAEVADEVVVMRDGQKIEEGTVEAIFNHPSKPYTQALLAAVPRMGSLAGQTLPQRTPLIQLCEDGSLKTTGVDQPQDTACYDAPLLQVEDLSIRFNVAYDFFGRPTHRVHAVEQTSFDLYPGETLALVGESGSGKTTVGKSIQQLIQHSDGRVLFNGADVFAMSQADRRRLKRDIQYVFQDPFASLDPRKKVAFSVAEPMVTHKLISGAAAIRQRVETLLTDVGLRPEHADRFPHEFSGGQRQRICIARALACEPSLIIADESVSALDVSTQAQIIDLFMALQEKHGLTYLFITHDMAVVEKISHRVAVMYLGQLVEMGTRQAVFETPRHPYTRRLLSAVPVAEPGRPARTAPLEGEIPSAIRKIGDGPALARLQEVGPQHWAAAPQPG